MPFIGNYVISNPLTVYLQTLSIETGDALNADSLPIYRVYHDLISTPLTTGTFSNIDNANVCGFYAATFTVSTTHGFSASGSYCIRKQVTMSSIVAAQLDTFRVVLSA